MASKTSGPATVKLNGNEIGKFMVTVTSGGDMRVTEKSSRKDLFAEVTRLTEQLSRTRDHATRLEMQITDVIRANAHIHSELNRRGKLINELSTEISKRSLS